MRAATIRCTKDKPMASAKRSSKNKTECGHARTEICVDCGVCNICNKMRISDLHLANVKCSELLAAAGESSMREERLRQMVSQGGHQFLERGERDLAFARIAILRRKLVSFLEDPASDRSILQTFLDEDDLTRTREIDDVLYEASSGVKKPVRKKPS
jgi:Na+-translocating ferredoxin:NAD+ oxidoreductase RnfC subunit